MVRRLRLGTRGSPLALAQSRLVARALAARHPDIPVELVTLETRGDRDRATPLQAVRDPDFFSADLDEALLADRVDCCVHSVKDLPPRRPPGILRAAVPVRDNPRDVVLFRPTVTSRLQAGRPLRLGTSSARRQVLVADFLATALPHLGPTPVLHCQPLRGPMDQRLARLVLPEEDPAALDGVVLALAGLARLWNDPDTRPLVAPALVDVRWMVLPLGPCPAAPGQGALALECRAGDAATRSLLAPLHDPAVAALLERELGAVATLPVAVQAAAGATAVAHEKLGAVCFLRGATGDHAGPEQLLWDSPPAPASVMAFDGLQWQRLCTRQFRKGTTEWPRQPAVFAAYWHGAEQLALPADARLWTSGTGSWRKLARRGLWVEGCGDHLGFASLVPTLACEVLGLPPLGGWTVLTHEDAVAGWASSGVGRVLATYRIDPPAPGPAREAVRAAASRATHCYWSSPDQFLALKDVVRTDAHHACGAGKTFDTLARYGLAPAAFPGGREWQAWLQGPAATGTTGVPP